MVNWLRTLAWMGLAVAATYTAAEWAVSHKATAGPGAAMVLMQHVPKKTVEQDGAGYVEPVQRITTQQASDAVPPIQQIDVEAAYEATLRKHVDKHTDGVHRLGLEMQRIERQLKVLRELKADQDLRLEMAGGS